MKPKITTDKSGKFEAVAHAILDLLNQYGVSNVTHSKVARASQVSRPWIYKYVGKNSDQLIEFAAVHFGKKLLEIGQNARSASTDSEVTSEALQSTWILMEKFSDWKEILPLYYRYWGSKNSLGKMIAEIEGKQLKEMTDVIVKVFKVPSKEARLSAELTLAMRMGLSFRYSQPGFKKDYSLPEVQKALRRIFEKSVTTLKAMEKI